MNEQKFNRLAKQIKKLGFYCDHYKQGNSDVIVVASPEGFNFTGKAGLILKLLDKQGFRLTQILREFIILREDGFSWTCDEPLEGSVDSIQLYFTQSEETIWTNSYPIKEVMLNLEDWYFPERYQKLQSKKTWQAAFKAMAWLVEILEMREARPTRLRISDTEFHFDFDSGTNEKMLWALLPNLQLVAVSKEANIVFPKWYCKSIEEHTKEFEKEQKKEMKKLKRYPVEFLQQKGIDVTKLEELNKPVECERGLSLLVGEPVQQIDYQDEESFEQYALKRCRAEYGEEHTQLLDLFFRQISQSEIAHQIFGDPNSQPTVAKRLAEIRLKSIGYWFEDWYRSQYGLPLIPDSEKNKPIVDALIDGVPHSLKCYLNTRRTVSLSRDALGPEIRYAEKHKTGLKVVFYSAYYHQEIIKDYSTSEAVPSTISLRFS